MAEDTEKREIKKEVKIIKNYGGGAGGAVYGMGLIGALVYYLSNAAGAEQMLLGILKSIFWPAFLIFRVLELLKM